MQLRSVAFSLWLSLFALPGQQSFARTLLRGTGWNVAICSRAWLSPPKRASIGRVVQQHAFLPADGPMAGGHVILTTDAPPVLQESERKHISSVRTVN